MAENYRCPDLYDLIAGYGPAWVPGNCPNAYGAQYSSAALELRVPPLEQNHVVILMLVTLSNMTNWWTSRLLWEVFLNKTKEKSLETLAALRF